jgi:hypothetical protein
MASMKFEEAVAPRPRCGGTTNWRDYPERNGSVSSGMPRNFGSGSPPSAKAFSEAVTAQ